MTYVVIRRLKTWAEQKEGGSKGKMVREKIILVWEKSGNFISD